MPTVTLNRKVVEKLVEKKLPEEKLKDRISMLGTDLEKVTPEEIIVEIFPNRPDLLSEQGFARAFSSFMGIQPGLKKYEIKKSEYKVIVDTSVKMRPYMVAAIVKNVKFDDERIREIMQVQEKLSTTHGRNRKKSEYGFYPLEKVHFPLTYIAKDPKKVKFKPLGFEEEMLALKVEEVHPKGIAYKWLAEDWRKQGYTDYPFLIDNKGSIMAMFPYTNSNDTGKIDETTRNVFIECTGIDLNNVKIALNILVTMLADMGGEIYSIEMEYPDKTITTPDLTPTKMKVDLEYINRRLGLTLKEQEVKKLLEQMGYGYEKGNALIPAYRGDILHQCDLGEDIAIAYGYEHIPEELPKIATLGKESPFEKLKDKIAQLLIGIPLHEVSTYHVSNRNQQCEKMNYRQEVVELANALTEEYNIMRVWLIPSLLEVLKNNKHHEYPQNIFMMGRVFHLHPKTETGTEERTMLSVMRCHEGVDYTEVKQILDYIMRMLTLSYETQETEHASFIPGRVASVMVQCKNLGFIGELSPEVLKNFELDMPVACFEIDLSLMAELLRKG